MAYALFSQAPVTIYEVDITINNDDKFKVDLHKTLRVASILLYVSP